MLGLLVAGTLLGARALPVPGLLRPEDLPGPAVFDRWTENATVNLPGAPRQSVAHGAIAQPGNTGDLTTFSVLPQVVPSATVSAVLELMRSVPLAALDADPDTVDGMPTYEMFMETHDLGHKKGGKPLDADPRSFAQRQPLRDRVKALLQPILDERITPFVRAQHPEVCGDGVAPGRRCTPCYSLMRRYRHGERTSHATHHDSHAIVTVVVSLSDYGSEYRGGLYVATSRSRREHLALSRGDAVVHRSTLLHGVHVVDADPLEPERTERWSWILWFRDSVTCEDHGHEWFKVTI